MNLKSQRRISAQLLKVGLNRVFFDPNRLDEIKEAITKADIRVLINDLAIQARPVRGVSRFRARKILTQKRKGRRKGYGSRKGKRTARLTGKRQWMMGVRAQRELIKILKTKELISNQTYRKIYGMVGGGFFRSRRHIKLYLTEKKLIKEKNGT